MAVLAREQRESDYAAGLEEQKAAARASAREWSTALNIAVLPRSKDRAEAAELQEQEETPSLREAALDAQAQERAAGALEEEQALARQGMGGAKPAFGTLAAARKPEDTIRLMFAGFMRLCWSWLVPSFFHTVYFLDLLFFVRWALPFTRKYIPAMGSEWLPASGALGKLTGGGSASGQVARLGIMLAEAVALIWLTLWIVLIDAWLMIQLTFVVGLAAWVWNHMPAFLQSTVKTLAGYIQKFLYWLF